MRRLLPLALAILVPVILVMAPGSSVAQTASPSARMVAGGGGAVRPVTGHVVRPFRPPSHAYGPGHRGVDLSGIGGTTVRVALAGTVTFAGRVAGVGWVTVRHGGGLLTTYGDVDNNVVAGDEVDAGDVIGRLVDGASHLDWGARLTGAYIDPMRLLRRWRLRLTAVDSVPTGQPVVVG